MGRLRKWLLHHTHKIVKWWAALHLPYTKKHVTGEHYYKIKPLLKPGHIFLTRIRGEPSNLLIPGFWTHAAIYTPNPNSNEEIVTEAIGKGVGTKDLISFLTSKDFVAIIEPDVSNDKGIQESVMRIAAHNAKLQVGKPYDQDFEFSITENNAFYCSELVWWAYEMGVSAFNLPCPFEPKVIWGEETLTPQEIFELSSMKKIYNSRSN